MKILLIKMSSMGDLVHCFPAVTDLINHNPFAEIHWLADQSFAEIPLWHPAIKKVYAIPLRTFKKKKSLVNLKACFQLLAEIRKTHYDLIIDAQGLMKSALISRLLKYPTAGFDRNSAREKLASYAYHHQYFVAKNLHAITRLRQLFAKIFHYEVMENSVDYGLKLSSLPSTIYSQPLDFQQSTNRESPELNGNTLETCPTSNKSSANNKDLPLIIFLPNTTWISKQWPINYWQDLAKRICEQGFEIEIPWGTENEKAYTQEIASVHPSIRILPKMGLTALAYKLAQAKLVIAVDTGLLHVAAALNVATISIYGATDANKTGSLGTQQFRIQADFPCSPCFNRHCKFNAEQNTVWPNCYTTILPEKIYEIALSHLYPINSKIVDPSIPVCNAKRAR